MGRRYSEPSLTQMTIQVPKKTADYIDYVAKRFSVSKNVVMNALIDFALAEHTPTQLDTYIQRNDEIIHHRLRLEEDDE